MQTASRMQAGAGQQPVMADAMKPLWQNVEQEAPDELIGAECHRAVPRLPVAAVILVAEGHAALVEGNEATVRDGDAMGSGRDRQALRLARRRPAFAEAKSTKLR